MYQRIKTAKESNPGLFVVVVDPRKTPTTEISDLHIPIKPGSDAYLFNGLLAYLDQHGLQDKEFTDSYCNHVAESVSAARSGTSEIAMVAAKCGITSSELRSFYEKFSVTEKVVTVFSQGINQSSSGVDKVNAIINCHLFTGRIGKQGMGPFSFTGQPNAMGGREVGGLSNQLAAHMEIAILHIARKSLVSGKRTKFLRRKVLKR